MKSQDPLYEGVTYYELHRAIDEVFVKGNDEAPTERVTELIDKIWQTEVFGKMYDEFVDMRYKIFPEDIAPFPVTQGEKKVYTILISTRTSLCRTFTV